jgi:hypothetical protein
MSTVFDEVSIKGLRKTHFHQLMSYIADRDRLGWYYGNRKQYEQRHAELKAWVQGIIDRAEAEGVIIPKK